MGRKNCKSIDLLVLIGQVAERSMQHVKSSSLKWSVMFFLNCLCIGSITTIVSAVYLYIFLTRTNWCCRRRLCRQAAVYAVEELHVQRQAWCAHEGDGHPGGPEGGYQGAWLDRILESPHHLLRCATQLPQGKQLLLEHSYTIAISVPYRYCMYLMVISISWYSKDS